jgi:hypothetical protein
LLYLALGAYDLTRLSARGPADFPEAIRGVFPFIRQLLADLCRSLQIHPRFRWI